VFVKLQPFLPEQRQFMRATGLRVAEARLYAAVGNELPVRVPRVWHSSFDDAEAQFVMVLEDLVASGCRFPGPDDADVLAVTTSLFDELALLHATYWDRELPWLGTHVLSTRSSKEQRKKIGGATAIVESALDQFAGYMPPAFRELGELYAARSREVAAMGSRWQPAEVARVAMERTTQAVIDLDVLGLLSERLG